VATITATASSNGGSLNAHVGDELVLHLPEAPTTGFRWKVEDTPSILRLEHDSFDAASGVGGRGTRRFQFRATAAGDARLALKQWREFEGEASVVERFHVTLRVA
jgi:inhibitor of cysteine peptidase